MATHALGSRGGGANVGIPSSNTGAAAQHEYGQKARVAFDERRGNSSHPSDETSSTQRQSQHPYNSSADPSSYEVQLPPQRAHTGRPNYPSGEDEQKRNYTVSGHMSNKPIAGTFAASEHAYGMRLDADEIRGSRNAGTQRPVFTGGAKHANDPFGTHTQKQNARASATYSRRNASHFALSSSPTRGGGAQKRSGDDDYESDSDLKFPTTSKGASNQAVVPPGQRALQAQRPQPQSHRNPAAVGWQTAPYAYLPPAEAGAGGKEGYNTELYDTPFAYYSAAGKLMSSPYADHTHKGKGLFFTRFSHLAESSSTPFPMRRGETVKDVKNPDMWMGVDASDTTHGRLGVAMNFPSLQSVGDAKKRDRRTLGSNTVDQWTGAAEEEKLEMEATAMTSAMMGLSIDRNPYFNQVFHHNVNELPEEFAAEKLRRDAEHGAKQKVPSGFVRVTMKGTNGMRMIPTGYRLRDPKDQLLLPGGAVVSEQLVDSESRVAKKVNEVNPHASMHVALSLREREEKVRQESFAELRELVAQINGVPHKKEPLADEEELNKAAREIVYKKMLSQPRRSPLLIAVDDRLRELGLAPLSKIKLADDATILDFLRVANFTSQQAEVIVWELRRLSY